MNIFGNKSISYYLYFVFKYGYYVLFSWIIYILAAHLLGTLSYLSDTSFGLFEIQLTETGYTLEIWPEVKLISSSGFLGSFLIVLFFSVICYVIKLMSGLFHQFMQNQIFKELSLQYIQRLAWVFLIVSVSLFTYFIIKVNITSTGSGLFFPEQDIGQALFLFILSIFLFFISEIFKRGIFLQKEQDMTI